MKIILDQAFPNIEIDFDDLNNTNLLYLIELSTKTLRERLIEEQGNAENRE